MAISAQQQILFSLIRAAAPSTFPSAAGCTLRTSNRLHDFYISKSPLRAVTSTPTYCIALLRYEKLMSGALSFQWALDFVLVHG